MFQLRQLDWIHQSSWDSAIRQEMRQIQYIGARDKEDQ